MIASLPPPALLLVEDDADEAARLASVLSHLGYRCTHAHDGDMALAWLARAHFDVILLDLVVPELDGMGLLQAMSRNGLDVPVVVAVTGNGADAATSAIRAGACDFVMKPAGALRLEVALGNAVALGRIRDGSSHPPMQQMPPLPSRPAPSGIPALPPVGQDGHVRPLELIEADLIRLACELYQGRLTEVAKRLGIGRSTLYRKLARIPPAQEGSSRTSPAHGRFTPEIVAAE